MNAARITPSAAVGYVRRNASGAVVATTPARAQDGTVSRCGCAGGGPGRYVAPGSTMARGTCWTYSTPRAAVMTAVIVTASASTTSPALEAPPRVGRRATARTAAIS